MRSLEEVLICSGARLLGHSSVAHCMREKDVQSQLATGPDVQIIVSVSTTFTQRSTPLVSKKGNTEMEINFHSLIWTRTDQRRTRGDVSRYSQRRWPVEAEAMNNQGLQHLTPMFTQSLLEPQSEVGARGWVGRARAGLNSHLALKLCFISFYKAIFVVPAAGFLISGCKRWRLLRRSVGLMQ